MFQRRGDKTPPCGHPFITRPLTVMSSTLIALLESILSVHSPTTKGTFLELSCWVIVGKVVLSNAPSISMNIPRVDSLLSNDLSILLGEGPNPEYMYADLGKVGCEPAPHLLYTARKASPLFLRRTM